VTAAIKTEIAKRIRALRISKGLSIDDVARTTGLTPTFLTRIENGKSDLSAEHLIAIAKALGVLVSVVIGEIRADDPQPKGE
jgi:transcriptional regulator with XRE-family HTH domain